jgi:hypothetical protein
MAPLSALLLKADIAASPAVMIVLGRYPPVKAVLLAARLSGPGPSCEMLSVHYSLGNNSKRTRGLLTRDCCYRDRSQSFSLAPKSSSVFWRAISHSVSQNSFSSDTLVLCPLSLIECLITSVFTTFPAPQISFGLVAPRFRF